MWAAAASLKRTWSQQDWSAPQQDWSAPIAKAQKVEDYGIHPSLLGTGAEQSPLVSSPAFSQHVMQLKSKLQSRIAAASSSPGWNEGWNKNCPWGAKCTDAACALAHPPEREDPKVSPEYIEELKAKMLRISGSSKTACRFGWTCNTWDCKNFHKEGRAIELNPESVICKFKRNCMRKNCYFHHPGGRLLDEDASKGVCFFGLKCTNPNCIFQHPEDPSRDAKPKRVQPRNCGPCNFCGEAGHIRRECPEIPGNRLRAEGFPGEWMTSGSESLIQNLVEYLSTFGGLSKPPEISQDFTSAIIHFDSYLEAKLAVQLTSGNGPFVLQFHHEDFGHEGAREKFSVHLGNLHPSTTEPELQAFCEEVGVVKSCRIIKDSNGKFKSDFGFCDFYDECTRQAAVDILNGKELLGNIIRIRSQGEDRRSIQHTELSGFPEWVWDLDHGEIAKRVTEIVTSVGQIHEAPEVDGRIVRIQFYGEPLHNMALLDFEGTKLELIPVQRPSAAQRKQKDKQFSVFIGNLSHDCSEQDIAILCSEFGDVDYVRIPTKDNSRRRYAFCHFHCQEAVELAQSGLHGREFKGTRLRCQGRGEKDKDEAQARSRSRSRSPRGRRGGLFIRLHVDELEMPLRPDVEPSQSECEVWLDKMPKEESEEWVSKFGQVEEVFRLDDKERERAGLGKEWRVGSGELESVAIGDRGYVRFYDHESAKRCVEAGVATWSESERILSSDRRRQAASVYPKSMISMLLGVRGARIIALKEELGLDALGLRGKGVGDARGDAYSERLHFFCKGAHDVLGKVQPVLEQLLADVHNEMAEILATPPEERSNRQESFDPNPPPPPGNWQEPLYPSPPPLPPPDYYYGMMPHAGAQGQSARGARPSSSRDYGSGYSANRSAADRTPLRQNIQYSSRPSSSSRGRPSSRPVFG